MQAQLALGVLSHFFEQLADALRIGAQSAGSLSAVLGERRNKDSPARCSELTMFSVPGASEYELALGQVEARAAEHEGDEDGDADEQTRRAPRARPRRRLLLRVLVVMVSRPSSCRARWPVAASQAPITVPKYNRSRRSITPLEIAWKCV